MSHQQRRTIALPLAMLIGAVFHGFFNKLSFLPPYLIFAMLFVTYCRVSAGQVRFRAFHWVLLAVQMSLGILLYLVLCRVNPLLAQGAMMCSFVPTAMAATTIGGMLGADVATMASFCLMSNMGVAVAAPVLFAAIGANPELSFLQSVGIILWKVVPLLILPFVCAVLLERFAPRWHKAVRDRQIISFWIWAASLTVVLGRTVEFLLAQPKENYTVEVLLAAVALVICLLQFTLGRYIGRRFGDTVAGGQSIGQKNTVTVYRLIAKDSLEEGILKLQESKKALSDDILSMDFGAIASMSKDELLSLLSTGEVANQAK